MVDELESESSSDGQKRLRLADNSLTVLVCLC